jgi:hypothetical protein
MTVLLDPTMGRATESIETVRRPQAIAGLTIGLLDISKARGAEFLNQVEARLIAQGATIKRFTKPTFAKPAPVDLRHEIATSCDAVIEALAD